MGINPAYPCWVPPVTSKLVLWWLLCQSSCFTGSVIGLLSPSSKQLYNVTNQLLGRTKKSSLPNNIRTSDLPDTFCQFFNNKIEQIRNDIDTQSADPPVFEPFTGSKFCDFEPVTEASMLELILKTASKSCKLDPIPTSLTKQYLDALVPVITKIINTSLTTGVVPDCFKSAIVKPLLKKQGLDVNDLKNFRPVSNLPFLSKILEKVVLAQLESHLSKNTLGEVCQSAYRQNHSTETLLLSVTVFFARLIIDWSRFLLYWIKVPLSTQLITKSCSTDCYTPLVSVALCSSGSYLILPTEHSLFLWET